MNSTIEKILLALHNSGFENVVIDTAEGIIYMDDPTCIARTFQSFLEIAWIAITLVAGMLTFFWAISLIRGVKNDLFISVRNLAVIFILLAALLPFVSKYLMDNACSGFTASLATVEKYIDERERHLKNQGEETYEILYVQDSGLQIPKEELEGLDEL